jgi:hypothetical protein
MIQAHIGRHPADPWSKGTLNVKTVKAGMGANKSLLTHVLGISVFVQDAVTNIEDAGLMAEDELTKRRNIPATGVQNQVAV